MENEVIRVVRADLSEEGAIVEFQDGRMAVYSAALLYPLLSQARELSEPEEAL